MTITCYTIASLDDAQALRVLRNECAAWMTRDTSPISKEKQERFYRERLATGQVEGFLMFDDGVPVAYGLLVPDSEGRVWSSTGVKTTARGKGLGRLATVEVARRAHARGVPIWAEVRRDNAGQQRICRTVGYEQVSVTARDGFVVDVFRCDALLPEFA